MPLPRHPSEDIIQKRTRFGETVFDHANDMLVVSVKTSIRQWYIIDCRKNVDGWGDEGR